MSYFPSLPHTPIIQTPSITPGLTQHQPHGNSHPNATRLHLLMPTVRPPKMNTATTTSPTAGSNSRSPRLKPAVASKLIRSRSTSVNHTSTEPSLPMQPHALTPLQTNSNVQVNLQIDFRPPDADIAIGLRWLGKPLRFEIVQEKLQISGYQMYAVEKWCVKILPLFIFICIHYRI